MPPSDTESLQNVIVWRLYWKLSTWKESSQKYTAIFPLPSDRRPHFSFPRFAISSLAASVYKEQTWVLVREKIKLPTLLIARCCFQYIIQALWHTRTINGNYEKDWCPLFSKISKATHFRTFPTSYCKSYYINRPSVPTTKLPTPAPTTSTNASTKRPTKAPTDHLQERYSSYFCQGSRKETWCMECATCVHLGQWITEKLSDLGNSGYSGSQSPTSTSLSYVRTTNEIVQSRIPNV